LLYSFLKIPAQLTLKIYCKKLQINNLAVAKSKGPLLLACNHPNSFLDAILFCTIFNKPIYSLARGDAFKKSWVAKVLNALHILPVFREREGAQNLNKNYDTFNECIEIFKQDGIVLIFSEALCINEWHLRPLKKGTARLATTAWQQNIPLQILPVGINYSSFSTFGKHIIINAGEIISKENFTEHLQSDGKLLNDITSSIQNQLSKLVYEIDKDDIEKHKKIFALPSSSLKKILLFLPAIIGLIVHLPFYFPLQKFVQKKALHSGHYDSIILGSCFLGYPFYLGIISLLIFAFGGGLWGLCSFLVMPLLAWCWVRWKD
jgi:1-acyl-sn-glycerol-3-phosphate acyltransferase